MRRQAKSLRKKTVTDEHIEIDAALIGKPLASPIRRGTALAVDLVLSFLVYLLCLVMLLRIQDPQFLTRFTALFSQSAESGQEQLQNLQEFLRMLDARCPAIFTVEEKEIFYTDSLAPLRRWQKDGDMTVTMNFRDTSTFDSATRHLSLGGDVLYGRLNSIFSKVTFFLIYFTLFPWIINGRTPGKLLLGIRIRRLSGGRLTLWDAFSRAGGYSASLSTAGLGFLEPFWDKNRQTIHDKITNTVVIRTHRQKKKTKRSQTALNVKKEKS